MEKQNYFTVDEANEKIPWLEVQLQTIVSLGEDIERLRLGNSYLPRFVRKETDAAAERLRNLAEEINDSGIILKDLQRGLVDFPTFWEGREVYLCWLLGEPSIQFWHEIDTGFSGRKPLF